MYSNQLCIYFKPYDKTLLGRFTLFIETTNTTEGECTSSQYSHFISFTWNIIINHQSRGTCHMLYSLKISLKNLCRSHLITFLYGTPCFQFSLRLFDLQWLHLALLEQTLMHLSIRNFISLIKWDKGVRASHLWLLSPITIKPDCGIFKSLLLLCRLQLQSNLHEG